MIFKKNNRKNRIKRLLIGLTFLLLVNASAQEMRTANGDALAKINEDRIVRGVMNEQLGEISGNVVENEKDQTIQGVVGDQFMDALGSVLGEVKIVKGAHLDLMAVDFVFCKIALGNKSVQSSGEVLIRSSSAVSQKKIIKKMTTNKYLIHV
jgi:hypothetical protein